MQVIYMSNDPEFDPTEADFETELARFEAEMTRLEGGEDLSLNKTPEDLIYEFIVCNIGNLPTLISFMIFICQYPRKGTFFSVEFPPDLKLLTPKEEETAWENAVEAARTCIKILLSKDKRNTNPLSIISGIVPAITNEMRKGDYLKSIYPQQFNSAVTAAEEDVVRFICSQLMHGMGQKVTKITNLELKEFPNPKASIIFESWLNTCLTRKTLISFDSKAALALVTTLGWHDFDTGDIHIFISPETTEFTVYVGLVHELVHHISLYSFGNTNKNTNNSMKLKRMGLKTVEALTQIITNHIVETNYDLRKDLKGLPSKEDLTKELKRHYPYEIETLQGYENYLKRNGLSISELMSALLSNVEKLERVEKAMLLQFINLEWLNTFVESYFPAHWNPIVLLSKFPALRRAQARAMGKRYKT